MNDTGRPDDGYRFIGKPIPRKEDARLTTGKGRFTDDFSLDGQTYAVMVRSPYPHARIVSIDASAAKTMPGVLAVLTGEDCEADALTPIPHSPVPSTKFDMKLTAKGGQPVFPGRHVLLPTDKARYVGEPVAMVVAETRSQAMDAAEAVTVEYEELPYLVETEKALRPGNAPLWEETPDNVLVDTEFGDKAKTDQAFAKAAHVVKSFFNIGRVTAVTMELRSCVGDYDPATVPMSNTAWSSGRRASSSGRSNTRRRARRHFSPTIRAAIFWWTSRWRSMPRARFWRCVLTTSAMSARTACRCRRCRRAQVSSPAATTFRPRICVRVRCSPTPCRPMPTARPAGPR